MLVLAMVAGASAQNQYFVANNGSNSNAGTSLGAPWLTISFAIANANLTGGAVINVAAGTYGEAISCAGRTAVLCVNRSGPDTSHFLIVKCSTQWSVPSGAGCLLRNNSDNGGISLNANNVEVNGFDWTNPGQGSGVINTCPGGPTSGACPTGNHVRIVNNFIHDIAQTFDDGAGGGAGCPSFGAIFSGSISHGTAFQTDVEIIGNRISNYGNQALAVRNGGSCNLAHGIYVDTPNVIVENNVIVQAVVYGIQFYSEPCSGVFSNNTIDQAGMANMVIAGGGCATPGLITIDNNICESAPGGCVQLGANGSSGTSPCTSSSHVKISNNILAPGEAITSAGSLNGCTDISGTITEAPTTTFSGYSGSSTTNNYALAAGSAARNAGLPPPGCVSGSTITPCVPTLAIDGSTRPNPPSIGAYDVGAGGGGVGVASLSPNPASFVATPIGSCSTPQPITLNNTGTASLTQNANSSITPNQIDFRFDFNPPGTCVNGPLAPGQTCTTNVKFCPSSLGAKTANFDAFTTAGNPSAVMNGMALPPPAPTGLSITVQ